MSSTAIAMNSAELVKAMWTPPIVPMSKIGLMPNWWIGSTLSAAAVSSTP